MQCMLDRSASRLAPKMSSCTGTTSIKVVKFTSNIVFVLVGVPLTNNYCNYVDNVILYIISMQTMHFKGSNKQVLISEL